MKMNFLKSIVVLAITTVSLTSCVSEDDFDIPTIKEVVFYEGFETSPHGAGANEVAVALDGWVNYNAGTGSRVWYVKQFDGSKFAEFSSFYSSASETDETWLITPEIALEDASYSFNFVTQARFFTNNNLSVYISQDFDGTESGIATATWVPLEATYATAANTNLFVPSGDISLEVYKNSNVRIAFKYVGSKQANTTTTFQLDNIKVFEN